MVDVHSLDKGELEQLVEVYPWFTVARKEYIVRLIGENPREEAARAAMRHAGIFLLSRAEFLKILMGRRSVAAEAAAAAAADSAAAPAAPVETPAEDAPKRKYYVGAGDYFGQEDFEDLERQGLAVETPSFSPVSGVLGGPAAGASFESPEPAAHRDVDGEIITETLAEIYAQQEIYKKATEIYEKLILLYPEKSAYFASLIEKVKNIK